MNLIRVLIFFVFNIALAALALAGVAGIKSASNLFLFITWLNFFISIVVTLDKNTSSRIKAKGTSVPLWVMTTFDWIILGFLAASGWFVTAAVLFLTWALQHNIYDDKE